MNTRTFFSPRSLITATLTLATLGLATPSAHAQFSFTAPTDTIINAHPGDTISFAGTFTNPEIEEVTNFTLIGKETKTGVASFSSTFFADLPAHASSNFTGKLKIFTTAAAGTTFFSIDANGTGLDTESTYDEFSKNFTINVTAAAVPEASTFGSFGLLLTGLGLSAFALRRRSRAAQA